MKLLYLTLFGLAIATLAIASPMLNTHPVRLLGAKECTWGPSYWCSNIPNAKSCNAVTHCIQTVWEKHTYPVDNDSICKICLDMVKQARDQLESNETQDELRQVFEGSCNLIPLKPIAKECDKLVDDFIPELIEALASQMEPNVVCSVAGLCNNVEIDKMLLEQGEQTIDDVNDNKLSCGNCNQLGAQLESKFQSSNRDDILENMIEACGTLSSFSDACANIVITYFNEIYDHLKENLKANHICHMSGVCAQNYHKHDGDVQIEFIPESTVGYVKLNGGDDIPCELCEQLVQHLRDVLIANTTESEFKMVLEGLCKQTKTFSSECLSIVDQYYEVIYNTLVNNLDANGACYMIGVCKKGNEIQGKPLLTPMVPVHTANLYKTNKPVKKLLGEDEPVLTNEEIQDAQLPIDRILGAPNSLGLAQKGEWCTICEYFWHYVQETLASPANEEEVKKVVGETCNRLPKSVSGQCHNFVDIYSDAIIALIIQNIDPSQLCPALRLCPAIENQSDMEVFSPVVININTNDASNNKSSCPLCLFAVTEAIESIRSDKSKAHIKQVLGSLCVHLPSKLQPECNDFISTYSNELIDMLATDFTPEQICVYFKLCADNKPDMSLIALKQKLHKEIGDRFQIPAQKEKEILTNEIFDNTINGDYIIPEFDYDNSKECALCTQFLTEAEKRIVNKKSKDQIKYALEKTCTKLKKLKTKCEQYIDQHLDKIIDLIMKDYAPKEICRELGLCVSFENSDENIDDLALDEALIVSVVARPSEMSSVSLYRNQPSSRFTETPGCILCEFVMSQLEKELADKKTQANIKHTVENICKQLPKTISADCTKFVDQYADLIISLLDTLPPKEICAQMMLCGPARLASEAEVVECAVCHGVVQALDTILEDPKIDDDIDNIFEKACNKLPAKYNKKCSNLVEIYGPSILNLLKSVTQPDKVCIEIAMCHPSNMSGFIKLEDI